MPTKRSVTSGTIARASDGVYRVEGALNFETVSAVLKQSASVMQKESQAVIDLGGVAGADSAGLALLIEWYVEAERDKRALRFIGVPTQLKALAKISDIDKILPFE